MSFEHSIEVSSLSKAYQIYNRPNDRLKQFIIPRVLGLLGMQQKNYYRDFWALNDISFALERGQTMGVIGRNGSGKSTLLQLICGTLAASHGDISVEGRVAALLELGSGFNPEFTGQQNIYLNAAILGLSNKDIDERYSDIVDFADIGDFVDQPVKTYSSGMMVRLAFAVIAHVDADILIIDEALAVGDAVFAQKCMRWLRHFQKSGTILFVSHDASSVKSLCNKAMWLHQGKCMEIGDAAKVCESYLHFTQQEIAGDEMKMEVIYGKKDEDTAEESSVVEPEIKVQFFENLENSSGWKTGHAEISSVDLKYPDGRTPAIFQGGEELVLSIKAKVHKPLQSPILGWFLKDRLGQSLFGEHTFTYKLSEFAEAGSVLEATFAFTLPLLPNGEYAITVSIADGDPYQHTQHHWLHDCILVHVSSEKLRYGLVGIPFKSVNMKKTLNHNV